MGSVHAHDVHDHVSVQVQFLVPVSARPHTRPEHVPGVVQASPLPMPMHMSSGSSPPPPPVVELLVVELVLSVLLVLLVPPVVPVVPLEAAEVMLLLVIVDPESLELSSDSDESLPQAAAALPRQTASNALDRNEALVESGAKRAPAFSGFMMTSLRTPCWNPGFDERQ